MKRWSAAGLTHTTTRSSILHHHHDVLTIQRRSIRNLHQYPHARYKSLVKDRLRFSRHWWLEGGNNHELVHEKGHEREATENFGVLRDDSANDVFLYSTNRLEDLPPEQRLNALVGIMTKRWAVRDNNRGMDKATLLLQALECFSEMRVAGRIKVFAELPEPDQDTFLQYVDGCVRFAQACTHSHPDAVAVMIRAGQICEEMRCNEKRDEVLQMAEVAAQRMDRALHHRRPQEQIVLAPPTLRDVCVEKWHAHHKMMRTRFKDQPWVLEKPKRHEFFRGARHRRIYHTPMAAGDPRQEMLRQPQRPEEDVKRLR